MKTLFTFIASFLAFQLFAQQNIADIRNLSENSNATASGIVINGDELGTVRYIQDNSGGLAIYDSKLNNVKRGDSITVSGEVHPYNNLFEITTLSSFTVHASGRVLPQPKTITIAEIGEDYEGQLIRINQVKITNANGTFSGNKNYEFTSGNESGVLRINTGSPIVGQVIPTDVFNLVAICSQYSFKTNDTQTGYQILPRDMEDFILASPLNLTSPLEISSISKNSITLQWTTDVEATSEVKYGIDNPESLDLSETGNSTQIAEGFLHEVVISGLNPASIVYAQAISEKDDNTAKSSLGVFATQSNSSGEIKVYFNTEIDESLSTGILAKNIGKEMEDSLIAYINRAKETIDVSIYNINNSGLSNVSQALNSAKNRGVNVRFITSGSTNHSGTDELISEIPVLESPDGTEYGIMHNKFAIFDADSDDPNTPWVWTGSLNISNDQVNTDAQNILFIQDQTLAKVYEIEFEEMWGGSGDQPNFSESKFGAAKTDNTPHELIINNSRVECYFSPSDNTNQKIIDAINTANNDLNIETMLITRTDIALAIKNAKQRGVDVHVLTNYINDNSETVNTILNEALPAGKFVTDQIGNGLLHHKLAIVDANFVLSDPQVITGSHNWSNSANDRNDENTLIIHNAEIANQYLQQFAFRFVENGGNLVVSAESIEMENIQIYPNPTVQKITVSSAISLSKIQIYSLSGEKINEVNPEFSNRVEINLNDKKPGIYILKVESENGKLNAYKIIKR